MIKVSMNGDVRSLADGVPSAFDFSSQAGILFVLRAIRAATIESADKNKLKDLVFLYNTGGKDEGVKRKLESLLETLGVTPESVLLEVKKVTPVASGSVGSVAGSTGYATGRRTPTFSAPVMAETPVIVPKADPISVTVKVPVTPTPDAKPTPVEAAVVQKITPVTPVPVQQTVPVSPKVVTPEPLVTNNIELEKKVVSPSSTSAPVSTPTAVESVASDATIDRIERIRVIKSDVNARVGNPVNLVDVDNVLGREYMSSLLEAMKLLSSASIEESTKAMNRLEAAYAQVLALLEAKAQMPVEASPVSEPVSIPSPSPVTVAEPEPLSMPVAEPVAQPVVVAVPVVPPPAIETFAIRSKVTEKVNQSPVPQSDWNQNPEIVQAVNTQVPVAAPAPVVMQNTEPAPTIVESVRAVYTPEVTASVSTVAPLKAITDLPTADEVSALENKGNDPLYTKDIDAGLDQLLAEWSLFKKSGLFGSGPKGREHPLYLKISPLQVPLILSGRFEGSTQEIKQSITDYMNGWRYEQGIIYEANETLDQYLRRVIRHIIDLQKAKRRS